LKLKAYLKPLSNWRSCCWCTNWGPGVGVSCFCFLFLQNILLTLLCIVCSTTHSKNWSIWTTYLGKKKGQSYLYLFLDYIAFMI
jgi:hypothetical protein